MKKILFIGLMEILLIGLMVLIAIFGQAQNAPTTISFQGYLTDQSGKPKDGKIKMTFSFWDAAVDGSKLWEETDTAVVVTKGLYNVHLGSRTSFPASLKFDNTYHLQVVIGAETLSRIKLSSGAYDLSAQFASNIKYGTLSTSVLPSNVPLGTGTTGSLTVWTGTNAVGVDPNLGWNGTTQTLSAAKFAGNGSLLTNLNGSSLPSSVPQGTGSAGQLMLWNGGSTVTGSSSLTWNSGTGTLTTTKFSGDGSLLTNLSGSSLPSSVPQGAGSAGQLMLWNGGSTVTGSSSLTWNSGTGTLTTTKFSGDGSLLTNLNGSSLPSSVPQGTGSAGQLMLWNGGSAVTGSSSLTWNSGTGTLTTTKFSGDGSLLTNLSGSSLPSSVPQGAGSAGQLMLWNGGSAVTGSSSLTWNSGTGTLATTKFSGDGSLLTNLSGSSLPSSVPQGAGSAGQLMLWNGGSTVAGSSSLTWNSGTTTLTAPKFSGDGSLLTNLSGSSLPSSVPQGTGSAGQLMLWNGGSTVAGSSSLTWNSGTTTLTAPKFSGDGSSVTSLNATNIATGTLNNSRLPTDIDLAGSLTTVGGVHVGGASAAGTDNLMVDGYTKIGLNAPLIQTAKYTGTTHSSASGGSTAVSFGTTVDLTKVLAVQVLVLSSTGVLIPPGFTGGTGFEYYFYVTATDVRIVTIGTNCANILSAAVRVLVTFEN